MLPYYRERFLAGAAFPDSWTRLTAPPACPACGRGCLVDPDGTNAGTRCMIEIDAGPDGLVLKVGCGYRSDAGELVNIG